MDPTRAQGLLGFSSSRWMDPNAGMDPKTALDKALFDQMQKIQSKKRQSAKEKVGVPDIWTRSYHCYFIVAAFMSCHCHVTFSAALIGYF